MTVLEFASYEDALDAYMERFSDGLPVVVPTRDRVEAMLAATERDADEAIGPVLPRGAVTRVRDVAINAVMAGATPAVFPLALAAVEAAVDPAFNLNGVQATTRAVAPLVIVSGPESERAGMNAGDNALGQGARANLTLGRTLRLVMTNIGGGIPGVTDMSVQGTPAKISFAVAERRGIAWPSLAEREGLQPEETLVLVAAATEGPHAVADRRSREPEPLLRNVAETMRAIGSLNAFCRPSGSVVIFGPQHARLLHAAGWDVERVRAFLFEHARHPVERLREAGEFDPVRSLEAFAPFGEPADPATRVPVVASPDHIIVLVAGGDGGGHTAVVPLWRPSTPVRRTLSSKRMT